MENKKSLIIIRYISIIFVILGMAFYRKNNVDVYSVVFVLLFIINNQLRFFSGSESLPASDNNEKQYNNTESSVYKMLSSIHLLSKRFSKYTISKTQNVLIVASLLLECCLAYNCYTNYGGYELFYFLSAVLDSTFLLDGKTSYILNGIILTIMIYIGRSLSTGEMVSSVSALLILSVFSSYIRKEHERKIKAEKLYDQLRISEDKLKKANDELEAYASSIEELTLLRERNRISREIHDSVGHSLSTMIIQLRAIEKTAENDGKSASMMAGNLKDYAMESLNEVRSAVTELKPVEFQKYQGILAVEELIKSFNKLTGIDVRLMFTKEKWILNSDQSFVIYRIVQEFLSNSLRHGKADRVNIFMNFSNENLIITLQDNGAGTDNVIKGVGLSSIWERVSELGGTVEYNSKKGEGFLLKVVLKPCEVLEF